MPNTNPSIGSRSTCRECGLIIHYEADGWFHYPLMAHPAVPIDHAEPVKTNAELLELAAKNPPPSEYFEGYMPNPFTEPSLADARTVEELVKEVRYTLTSAGWSDQINEGIDALDELARRLGVTHV